MQQTVCLNMIVKNESHIIESTLTKLLQKFPIITHWVISDTGSTDNTIEIIQNFFKSKNIPGEIFNDEWKNFSYNRSQALREAYNKTDYLLIFDADDEISGNITFPRRLTADAYNMKLGSPGFSYERPLLINNRKKWEFKSVIHEYLSSIDHHPTYSKIEGDYYVISGKSGARSQDPQKYVKDAQLLERSFDESLEIKDGLHNRYAFYCANSYKDAGMPDKAIDWYKKTLTLQGWIQERYVSCIQLHDIYKDKGETEKALYYALKSHEYDHERLEGIYKLVCHYCCEGNNEIAYAFYSIIQEHYEKNYSSNYTSSKLFVDLNIYDFFMPYHMVIVAEKLKKYDLGIKFYRIVFQKKPQNISEWHIKMFLFNMQFFMNRATKAFIKEAKEYVKYLISKGINVESFDFLDRFKNYDIFPKSTPTIGLDECIKSKNIIVYTGFSNEPWNYTYSLTNALGGSETAVAYLTTYFPKDYNIFVCGGVKEETIGNIQYVPLDKIPALVKKTAFKAAIISRYVGFLEQYNFSAHKVIIWAHDTHLLPYGCDLSNEQIIQKYQDSIDAVVCLTQWHKELFQAQYPQIKQKIVLINNGLKEDLFNIEVPKKKNQFVYTSCSERGLNRLLELWESILQKLPDATLKIASYGPFPKNEEDIKMDKIIKTHPNSIQHLGKLGSKDLYELLCSSEYWLYPTCWQETSCITALEMLRCGVICVYYPVAGLPFTLDGNGFQTSYGEELNTILNLTDEQKQNSILKGKQYASECTWKNRSVVWKALIEDPTVKIINLERRDDRKQSMLTKLSKSDVMNYSFVKAVDGEKLKLTKELQPMFKSMNKFQLRRGVVGNILSHMKVWESLVKDNNRDYYVVLEDDTFIRENLNALLSRVCSEFISKDCEFLFIGRINLQENTENDVVIQAYSTMHYGLDWGNYSYIIHKNAAKKLIDYYYCNSFKHYLDYVSTYSDANVKVSFLNEAVVTSYYTTVMSPGDSDVKVMDNDPLTFDNNNPETYKNEEYTFPVHIVNMEKRADRKQSMIKQLDARKVKGYDFFTAVDGKALKNTEFIRNLFYGNEFNYQKTVIGASLSHLELWRKLVASDDEYFIILEDDVDFCHNFSDKLDVCLKVFNQRNLEFLYIGSNLINCTNSPIETMTIGKCDLSIADNHGAFGYIIRKKAAVRMLDYICKYSLDCAIDCRKLYANTNTDCYAIVDDSLVYTKMAIHNEKLFKIDSDVQYDYISFEYPQIPKDNRFEDIARKYYFLDADQTLDSIEGSFV